MRQRPRHGVALAFVLLAMLLPSPRRSRADDAPSTIAPQLQAAADALVAAFAAGDAAGFERLAQERFAPTLLARRTAAERAQLVARFHGDFGACRVAGVRPSGPWAAEVEVRAASGNRTGLLQLELEPAPPHRIQEFGMRVTPGGPGSATRGLSAPPPLRGVEDPARLGGLIDAYLQPLAADERLSGVVVVARHGKPVYQRAFGLADRERRVANTVDTRFNLASIGKHFTRVAIGQLLQQGKLALDDVIGKHLPRYPNADAARKVTIRQLLEHQGGVVDVFDIAGAGDPPPRSNREWFGRVAPRPLEFEPGTQTRYCNGCYVVLGEIVAAISGTSYEDYLAKHVFAPAAMKGAAFLANGEGAAGQARGYTRGPRGLELAAWSPGGRGNGAGGVYATASDLLAYEAALREGKLLDRERTAWVLGAEETPAARPRLGIAGGGPGTNTILSSDGDWTVIVLTNQDPQVGQDVGAALAGALRS